MKRIELVRLSVRDAWGSRRTFLWPTACLILATLCFHTLHHLSLDVENTVVAKTQELSGGDLDLASPHVLTIEQRTVLHEFLSEQKFQLQGEAQTTEFLSMMMPQMEATAQTAGPHSRLVEVHAVSPQFPLYGELKLKPSAAAQATVSSTIAADSPVVHVTPEFRALIATARVRIGKTDFKLGEDVISEPGGSLSPFPIAPHAWMAEHDVAATGLLQTGSRIRYRDLLKLDHIPDATFVKELKRKLGDDRIQIHTATTSSSQIEKLFERVFRFSRLASLLAMTLALLAAGVGLRLIEAEQTRTRTTLHILGLSLKEVRFWRLAQIVLLVVTSVGMGWFFSMSLAPPLSHVLLGQFQLQVNSATPWGEEALLALFFLILISSLLILQSSKQKGIQILAALATLATTVLLINDLRWGLGFWAAVILVSLVFRFCIQGLLRILEYRVLTSAWGARIQGALRVRLLSLVRHPKLVAQGMSGVGLGLFLVFGILIFRDSLLTELASADGPDAPSLFLIDVGTDQKDAVEALLQAENTHAVWSRFVKARLLSVNGKSPEEVPEEERLHREFNLNDRENLDETEKLVAGHWWTGKASEASTQLEASVEKEFASRMGLKLGDHVSFDLQGVAFDTRVTSLRRVDWTSFHPNFFFLIQPGFLDSAPQTWIAAVSQNRAAPGLVQSSNLALQDKIVQLAPNVTVVDLVQTLSRVRDLIHSIEIVITYLAILIVAAGVLLLISSLMELSRVRQGETALLRALGASQQSLSRANLWESLAWAILILLVGIPLAILSLWIVIVYVLQSELTLFTTVQFGMALGFLISVLVITWIVQRRSRAESATQLLRAG